MPENDIDPDSEIEEEQRQIPERITAGNLLSRVLKWILLRRNLVTAEMARRLNN